MPNYFVSVGAVEEKTPDGLRILIDVYNSDFIRSIPISQAVIYRVDDDEKLEINFNDNFRGRKQTFYLRRCVGVAEKLEGELWRIINEYEENRKPGSDDEHWADIRRSRSGIDKIVSQQIL